MYSHAPTDYRCPLCRLIAGEDNAPPWSQQSDVVWRTATVTAFLCAKQWPHTPGHVLVVPNAHVENLYTLSDEIGAQIFSVSRQVALAMKAVYGCSGISTRQHNEPAGNQDVWHYHLHVFPRYQSNDLYPYDGVIMPPAERALYAARLRDYFTNASEVNTHA